jgi:nicotinamide/nicotinate riboside kinase
MQGETERRWGDAFERLEMEMRGEGQEIVWGLVDGFLLYWNQVRTDPV